MTGEKSYVYSRWLQRKLPPLLKQDLRIQILWYSVLAGTPLSHPMPFPPNGGFCWLICLTASVLYLYRDLLSCKVLVRTPRRAGNHGFLTKLTGTSYRTMFRVPVRIDMQICIYVRVQIEYLRHWFFSFGGERS